MSQSNESRDGGGVVRRNNEDQASASDGLYSVDSRRLEPAIKGKRGTTNRAVGFALAERQAERRTRSSTRVLLVDVAGRIRQGPSRCAQSRNSVTRPTRVGPPIVHPSRRGLILLQLSYLLGSPMRSRCRRLCWFFVDDVRDWTVMARGFPLALGQFVSPPCCLAPLRFSAPRESHSLRLARSNPSTFLA